MKSKEILKELREIHEKLDRSLVYGEVLRDVVGRQEKQISALQDRLMARNFPELKSYEASEEETPTIHVDLPEFNEDFSGEIVENGIEP